MFMYICVTLISKDYWGIHRNKKYHSICLFHRCKASEVWIRHKEPHSKSLGGKTPFRLIPCVRIRPMSMSLTVTFKPLFTSYLSLVLPPLPPYLSPLTPLFLPLFVSPLPNKFSSPEKRSLGRLSDNSPKMPPATITSRTVTKKICTTCIQGSVKCITLHQNVKSNIV